MLEQRYMFSFHRHVFLNIDITKIILIKLIHVQCTVIFSSNFRIKVKMLIFCNSFEFYCS
jgi:hypothetical protein